MGQKEILEFADQNKELMFKADPTDERVQVSDVACALRVPTTGMTHSPRLLTLASYIARQRFGPSLHMYIRSRFGPRHNSLALAGPQLHPSPHHHPCGFS